MTSHEPDYTKYSLAELVDARNSIDESRFPERAAVLTALIKDRGSMAERREEPIQATLAANDGAIASVKPGRSVSFGRGITEIVGSVLFAGLWISQVGEDANIFAVLIGWFVGIAGVVGGSWHLYNAFAQARFSQQDIVAPGAEPDPFARAVGRERGAGSRGDSGPGD